MTYRRCDRKRTGCGVTNNGKPLTEHDNVLEEMAPFVAVSHIHSPASQTTNVGRIPPI